MGLFRKKSSESGQIEVNEDYESEARRLCENIDNANLQIKIIKKEYDEVNSFLQDAQIIERMPEEPKEELVETAGHLIALRKDIVKLKSKRADLTEFEFGIMEKYEEILPDEIKRLKREEDYELAIKGDLRKLAGEKAVLIYEKEIELNKKSFLSKLGIMSGIVIGLLLIMYLILYIVFETFADIAFLLTIIGGIFMAFYIFIETDKNGKELRLNAAKEKKLISLTNIVKIKYVNQKASVDFSHDKYAVNNVMELEYRYNQYAAYKKEEMMRKKASAIYEFYNNKYKDILREYGIHDVEVWSYQAEAVADRKEMVEIRHKLNERRQNIRGKLEENMKKITDSGDRLTKIGEKSPELSVVVNAMMELYNIGTS